jgi:hypothetical protein
MSSRKRNTEIDKSLVEFINISDTFWLEDAIKLFGNLGKVKIRRLQLKNKVQCCTIGRGDSKRQCERKFLVIDKITEEDLYNAK